MIYENLLIIRTRWQWTISSKFHLLPFKPFSSSVTRVAPDPGRCGSSGWGTALGLRCSPQAMQSSIRTIHSSVWGLCWISGTFTATLRVCRGIRTATRIYGSAASRLCFAGSPKHAATWPRPPTQTSTPLISWAFTTPPWSASF